jgi:hypothetical protein
MFCINKNSEEFKSLVEQVGFKDAVAYYLAKGYIIEDTEFTPTTEELEEMNRKLQNTNYNNLDNAELQKSIKNLEKQIIDGFLADYNFTITEYENLKQELGVDSYTATDLITKAIAYEKGESILPEVAYIAYSILGKQNNKIRYDLRYLVNKWDKYNERFNYHKKIISEKEGFINDKKEWRKKIKDLVILDFLRENIEKYYFNTNEFTKINDSKWTKEDFTLWEKIIRALEKFLENLGIMSNKRKIEKLKNIGLSVASEILTNNYEYFNYNLSQDQIRKYYKNTIESDLFAKELVEFVQSKIGLVLTGSLALRKAGSVYRTVLETIHDIDWVVPFEKTYTPTNIDAYNKIINGEPEFILDEYIESLKIDDVARNVLYNIQKLDWFQDFVEKYPSFEFTGGFYGGEHTKNESFTAQGVVNGEFYTEDGTHEQEFTFYSKDPITKKPIKVTEKSIVNHRKGEYIKGTGYAIDFFVRLKPYQEQHENYFKLWKEIMIAKIKMGRDKDFIDWKAFIPYLKSANSFNFNYEGFRHFNYESSKTNLLEEHIVDTSQPIEEQDTFTGIKSGVEELFESNSELANGVYEALGFKEKLSSITPKVSITNYRTMDDKSKKDAIDGVEEAQRRWVEEEIAEFYEAVYQYNNNLDTFSSKGVNKGKATIDDVIDETLGIFRTIQMFPKFSDLILPYIDDIQIAIDSFGRKEGYAIYKAKKDKKGQAKEMTYENLFEVVDKYMKPFQITPQQKQQALQLYSQYLDTIFPGSKVKDIFYHETSKYSKEKILQKGFNAPVEELLELGKDSLIWFSRQKNYYRTKNTVSIPAILNSISPKIDSHQNFERVGDASGIKKYNLEAVGADAIITEEYADEDLPPLRDLPEDFVNPIVFAAVIEPEQIHRLGTKQDIERFKQFVKQPIIKPRVEELFEYNPELANAVYEVLRFKQVYQGYNKLDNRKINYFTVDKNEASNYGSNVRNVILNTSNLLKGYSNDYNNLLNEYYKITNSGFDLLDNSKKGIENQNKFFEFIKEKGYKGLDFTMFSDSKYIVSFENIEITPQQKQQALELYSQYIEQAGKQDIEEFKEFVGGNKVIISPLGLPSLDITDINSCGI